MALKRQLEKAAQLAAMKKLKKTTPTQEVDSSISKSNILVDDDLPN